MIITLTFIDGVGDMYFALRRSSNSQAE